MSFSGFTEVVPGLCWAYSTSFRFFSVFPINNNGLIVKAREISGQDILVAVNCPQLVNGTAKAVHELEETHCAKLKWILGTDWHHVFAKSWVEEFPQAKVVFPGTRAQRVHEKDGFDPLLLSRDAQQLELPDVDSTTFQLVPWRGFHGTSVNHPDENPRGEYCVYLPTAKLLYVFDILIPSMPPLVFAKPREIPLPRANFGTWLSGFKVVDKALCAQSAQRLLEMDVETCVFSHGELNWGAIRQGKDQIDKAFAVLKTLLE